MAERARRDGRCGRARSWRSSRSCRSCAARSSGASFYFRDLSLHFFPLRRFALEGLRAGRARASGTPTSTRACRCRCRALGYPLDLLGVLGPTRRASRCCWRCTCRSARSSSSLLARGLGLGRRGGRAAARSCYALGGFYLSTLNLYVYLQAAAWAPLVVLGLVRRAGRRRAAARSPRAALAVAVALSTTGVEIVAQAVVAGVRARASAAAPAAARAARPRCGAGARRGARRARARARGGPGGGQRARPGLPDGRRARPLGPPVRPRPDPRGRGSSATSRTSRTSGGARTSSRAASRTC